MPDKPMHRDLLVTPDQRDEGGSAALRCQWCSVQLPDGTTVCPTCGSPGIPDPNMTTPEIVERREPDLIPANDLAATQATPDALVEWWRKEEESEDSTISRRPIPSFEETEQRRTMTILFIVGATIFCAFVGWLIAPALLDGPIESLTGTPVEDPGDLRGMGAFMGMLFGMLLGATGGFVIWLDR